MSKRKQTPWAVMAKVPGSGEQSSGLGRSKGEPFNLSQNAESAPSSVAPQEQCNAFSTTSAREQSSATASFRLGVLLTDKIWQLRERGKELAKNPQEYFRGLADGFESLANELEALARPSVGEQK